MTHYPALTEYQETLIHENMELIGNVMKTLPAYLFDSRDDAFQIGSIGLIKAARSFDPERNILFRTYASRCIENELRMAMRHRNRAGAHAATCSLDACMEDRSGDPFVLSDMLKDNAPSPEDICVAKDTLAHVVRFMNRLQDNEARIILQMILRRCSQMEMARAVGCTQSAVSRKLKRIRSELREAICTP